MPGPRGDPKREPDEFLNLHAPLRNLMTKSCFPRDLPSTAQIVATYTLRVEGDPDQASMGVFPVEQAPIDEQVPLQLVSVSCKQGSS